MVPILRVRVLDRVFKHGGQLRLIGSTSRATGYKKTWRILKCRFVLSQIGFLCCFPSRNLKALLASGILSESYSLNPAR